jgi:hypothetical protein
MNASYPILSEHLDDADFQQARFALRERRTYRTEQGSHEDNKCHRANPADSALAERLAVAGIDVSDGDFILMCELQDSGMTQDEAIHFEKE